MFGKRRAPSGARPSDVRVLDVATANGAKLDRVREVNFYFYGEAPRLPGLVTDLEGLGFSIRLTNGKPGAVATLYDAVNEDWLDRMIPQMTELADRRGVEFDGWEMSMPELGH